MQEVKGTLTFRFTECANLSDAMSKSAGPNERIGLRAVEILCRIALDQQGKVPDKLSGLICDIASQPASFTVAWAFNGEGLLAITQS